MINLLRNNFQIRRGICDLSNNTSKTPFRRFSSEQSSTIDISSIPKPLPDTKTKIFQSIFGKSTEIRTLLAIGGGLAAFTGALWNFTHNLATKDEMKEMKKEMKDEMKEMKGEMKNLESKIEGEMKNLESKIDGIRDALLNMSLNGLNIENRNNIALRQRIEMLERNK